MKRLSLAMAGYVGVAMCAAMLLAQDSARPVFGTWGVDVSGMDKSVHPGDDFFRYVNGKWYDQAAIPADRTATGGFSDLSILSEKRLGEIVAALEAKPYSQLTGEEKQLRDLYDAFTETDAIEKNGLKPAEKALAYFASIQTLDGVARAMGDHRFSAGDGNLRLFSDQPNANPKMRSAMASMTRAASVTAPEISRTGGSMPIARRSKNARPGWARSMTVMSRFPDCTSTAS